MGVKMADTVANSQTQKLEVANSKGKLGLGHKWNKLTNKIPKDEGDVEGRNLESQKELVSFFVVVYIV